MEYKHLLAKINSRAKGSVIRELLKFTNKPGLISFAGGMPDPGAFPTKEISSLIKDVVEKEGKYSLQYGCTEGETSFKKEIIKMLKEDENIDIALDELMITSASQQGLDIVSKAFIDEGDNVIVSMPTYLGALQAFNAYGA